MYALHMRDKFHAIDSFEFAKTIKTNFPLPSILTVLIVLTYSQFIRKKSDSLLFIHIIIPILVRNAYIIRQYTPKSTNN